MLKRLHKPIASISLVAAITTFSVATSVQPDLTFTTPDGRSVLLSSLRGKVVVLLFAGVQDPQCRDEFKALESLSERYRGKNVNIYWVSINPPSVVSDQQLKNPCGPAGSVAILRDPNQVAFKRFSSSVAQLPTLVIIDQRGQLYGQPRGGFNSNADFVNDLASIIDSLLTQK
jgi:peroxiredoxin